MTTLREMNSRRPSLPHSVRSVQSDQSGLDRSGADPSSDYRDHRSAPMTLTNALRR